MLLMLIACLPWRTVREPEPRGPDRLHALLLNGGSQPEGNWSSHLAHLQETRQVLVARGFQESNIHVFDSDGGAPGADQAYGYGEIDGDWTLIGSAWEDLVLVPPLRDGQWEVERRPATRDALGDWFESAPLESGDLLLLYVTDHGTPDGLSLWGEELAPWQLAQLVDRLPSGVRVVFTMNQCFAGGFQGALDPAEDQCALFAVPADRMSNGCYPIEDGARVGHAFELAEALTWTSSLDHAHAAVSLSDDTPDVPMLSSDILLAEYLPSQALDQLGDLTERRPELAAFHALGDRFGLPALPGARDLERDARAHQDAADEAHEAVMDWTGLLAEANALSLRDAPDPPTGAQGRELVVELSSLFLEHARSQGHERTLRGLVDRVDESLAALLSRSTASAVRLRQLIALRRLVAHTLESAERDRFEHLRTCESEPLGVAPTAEPPPLQEVAAATLRAPGVSDFGVSLDRDRVTSVRRNSPGAALGLLPGDRLVQVDGETSPDWLPFALALEPERVVVERAQPAEPPRVLELNR